MHISHLTPGKKKLLIGAGISVIVGLIVAAVVIIALVIFAANKLQDAGKAAIADKASQQIAAGKEGAQSVIDENAAKIQKDQMDQRLGQAVQARLITEEQKTAITSKYQELDEYRKTIVNQPVEEQRKLMDAKFEEVKQWAETSGLGQYISLMQAYYNEFFKG